MPEALPGVLKATYPQVGEHGAIGHCSKRAGLIKDAQKQIERTALQSLRDWISNYPRFL
jgi:hypothetical protein